MAKSITITNSAGNKFAFFDATVPTFTLSKSNKLFQQSLPGAAEEDAITITLGVEGQRTFSFKILDSGTDVTEGSPGGIITIIQQINYLFDTFFSADPEAKYTLEVDTTHGTLTTKSCFLSDISIDISGLNPESATGNLKFSLGGGSQ